MEVDQTFLDRRAASAIEKGFGKQKWVEFCEVMLCHGLRVHLYEARKTFSKYVTVSRGKQKFKVRFSNHKPIKRREENGDCDFFVGVTNTGSRTTEDAIKATLEFFTTPTRQESRQCHAMTQ